MGRQTCRLAYLPCSFILLAVAASPALATEKGTRDVWLLETEVRAQLTNSLIGAIGMGVGLNRGQETPVFSVTVGFQFSL